MTGADIANLQTVTFQLGEENFLVEIMKVQEIIRMVNITKVPNSPDFVEGVINLRGRIVPIVDLRKKFMMPAYEGDKKARRIIIIEIGEVQVGCVVDLIREVLKIEKQNFSEAPEILLGVEQRFIKGIIKYNDEIYILLDVDSLLSKNEKNLLASSV